MFVLATVLAALAVGAAFFAYRAREERRDLLSIEVTGAADLRALRVAATAAAGEDTFVQRVELSGRTGAPVDGLLTSVLTDTPCVWHRQKVTRRYEEVRRRASGIQRDTTVQREQVVADHHSTQAFFVVDDTGRTPVVPDGSVHGAHRVLSEFRMAAPGKTGDQIEIGSRTLDLSANRGDTIGFTYEEWVLPEGVAVFVRGEAADRDGLLTVCDPRGKDTLLITTRTEGQLLDSTASSFQRYAVGAAGLAVSAVVALVVALVR